MSGKKFSELPAATTLSGEELFALVQSGVSKSADLDFLRGGMISIKDFGATGTGDDTAAIQAAIDAAEENGGGVVLIPLGVYQHTGLTITAGISLVGVGWEPYTAYSTTATVGAGSYLKMTATGVPAITISRRSGARTSGVRIKHIGMVWDQPAPTGGWTPTVYEWAIKAESVDDVIIEDVFLQNAYKGVQMTGTLALPAGRMTINGLYGQPLSIGIDVDFAADVVSLNRIHFWPFWSDNANVLGWMKTNNSTALKSSRNDNCQVNGFFCFSYARGLHFSSNAAGISQRFAACNVDIDDAVTAFYTDTTAVGCSGVITNMHATANPATSGANLFVSEAVGVEWSFVNLRLTNSQEESIYVTGTNSRVRICNFYADDYNVLNNGSAMIFADTDTYVWVENHRIRATNTSPIVSGTGRISIDEWITYTPTLTASTGTFTTADVNYAKYRRKNDTIDLAFETQITTNGTANNFIVLTLPFTAAEPSVLNGRERNATGAQLCGQILTGGTTVRVARYDNVYAGGNNTIQTVFGTYRAS